MRRMRWFSWCVGWVVFVALSLALWAAVLARPHPAMADGVTWFVTASGTGTAGSQQLPCALQTALERASDGDVIYVAEGTYTSAATSVISTSKSLTLLGGWDGAPSGSPQRNPLTFPAILDGRRQGSVVWLSRCKPVLDGFTITGGWAAMGAGIYIERAQAVIRNNTIVANQTYTATTWQGGRGAGLSMWGAEAVTITANHFISNTSGYGGAIYVSTLGLYIADNDLSDNYALKRGGGICFESGCTGVVQDNLFQANVAGDDGGAMLIWHSNLMVQSNRLVANTARQGAGVSIGNKAMPCLVNNWFWHNAGPAISSSSSSPAIVNNTIVGMTGQTSLFAQAGSPCMLPGCGALTVTNNIIMGGLTGIDVSGMLTGTIDHNNLWANSREDYAEQAVTWRGAHNLAADPLLISVQAGDLHLAQSSPCIDAGDARAAPLTDIDGDPRPQGRAPDIGADERGAWTLWLPALRR